jgi:hypothetical protein
MFRFQYFAALPNVSQAEWPSASNTEHILFTEDLADLALLRIKMKVPVLAPHTISAEVNRLHRAIAGRYVGLASLVSLKTAREGLREQGRMLGRVSEEHVAQPERVYRLGREQQAIFNSHLQNFTNFGGHGSG